MLNIDEFLTMDISAFVLGSFFSKTTEYQFEGNSYFFTYCDFKQSAKVNKLLFDFNNYNLHELVNDLNVRSWPGNWMLPANLDKNKFVGFPGKKAIYIIENNLNITHQSFMNKLYYKITSAEWANSENNEFKRDFVRGFFEPRGSTDVKANYFTMDYNYSNRIELSRVRLLYEMMDVPIDVLNFNFRELQQQQVNKIANRATQIRIRLNWYAANIGYQNEYKSFMYKSLTKSPVAYSNDITYYNDTFILSKRDSESSFSKYLGLYSEHIFKKDLTKLEINELRKSLDFDKVSDNKISRNKAIVNLYKELTEDICGSCRTRKTTTNAKTNRQNFDIHHFIPFGNDKLVLDNIDNLVKLCPNCHDALTKGRVSVRDQIKICKSILNNNIIVKEFAESYFETNDVDYISVKVQELLL